MFNEVYISYLYTISFTFNMNEYKCIFFQTWIILAYNNTSNYIDVKFRIKMCLCYILFINYTLKGVYASLFTDDATFLLEEVISMKK